MKNLLVIDDSAIIRKVARRVAEGQGLAVSDVETCADAIAQCEQQMPEVVLLDRGIPDMPAMEFVARLRAMPGGDRPQIICCLSENEPLHMAIAKRHGLNDYIVKPFELDTFREKLDRAVFAFTYGA